MKARHLGRSGSECLHCFDFLVDFGFARMCLMFDGIFGDMMGDECTDGADAVCARLAGWRAGRSLGHYYYCCRHCYYCITIESAAL